MRLPLSVRITLLASVALSTLGPALARAEVSAGITAGAALAGDQDIGISLFGPRTGARVVQKDLPARTGALAGLAVTAWPDSWRWFGVGVEGLFWDTPMTSKRGHDISQTRSAMLVETLVRYRFSNGVFVYGGPVAGFAYTTVHRGSDQLGPAVGALSGLAIPVTTHLRLRFEVQYLATHDVDSPRTPRQRVDTSGNARNNPAHLMFGAHLDTQFLPLRVGLDWVFP
jgi:hypothetical protein